jgi:hypothetical protein
MHGESAIQPWTRRSTLVAVADLDRSVACYLFLFYAKNKRLKADYSRSVADRPIHWISDTAIWSRG